MATTEEKMTTPTYLKMLGWDAEKWTVLKEEEWLPLQKVSGYQTYVYDAVKDPTGRQMFGKNARVVKTEWMNKHMASVTEVAAPPVEVDNTPPPPVQEADTTPPPPANVPEEIKEIAEASPNLEIVSVPAADDKQLGLRKAQMAAIGWTVDDQKSAMTKDDIFVSYMSLREQTDDEFYAMLSEPTKKEEPKEVEVIAEEVVSGNEWDKFVHDRVEQLLSYRFKVDEKDKELLHTSDGELISYEDIDTMENDDWIAYIKLYKSLMAATPGKEKELRQVQIKKAEERAEETAKATAKKIEDQRAEDKAKRDTLETEKNKKLQEDATKKSQEITKEAAKEKDSQSKGVITEISKDLEQGMDNEENEKLIKEHEARAGKGEHELGVSKEMQPVINVHEFDNEMTTGDTGGFFHQLANLGFGQLSFSMNSLKDGKISITAEIRDTGENCSSEFVQFKEIIGTAKELDKIFMNKISQPFK